MFLFQISNSNITEGTEELLDTCSKPSLFCHTRAKQHNKIHLHFDEGENVLCLCWPLKKLSKPEAPKFMGHGALIIVLCVLLHRVV